jgi:transcriptional regulator GlxA family with amidase domain
MFERGLSHRGLPLKRQIPTEVLRQDQSRSSVHHEGCAGKAALPVPRRAALGLLERDMGGDIARATAKMMIVHHRRAGGQSQYSATFELDAKSDRVQDALAFARNNLRRPLTVEQLAEAARLSPRQFTRVFRAETGQSPARAVENLRLEAARYMLEQGRLPVEEIAQETGFGDRERMRRSFLRTFGQTPQAIRNASHPLATI